MTDRISFNEDSSEIIRIDQRGFHYKGQLIEDAGEAYRLLVEFLRKYQPDQQWGAEHNDTPLSPAAQAVLDATTTVGLGPFVGRAAAAAALRAAADGWRAEVGGITQTDFIRGVLRSAEALDEIATELDGGQ